VWYAGLVQLAGTLGETCITAQFAEPAASFTSGWPWWGALIGLLLVYFYAHYGFASITAHATAMYIPFLAELLAAGVPGGIAAFSLAYASTLMACLTHYGTTPGPIYYGSGYVPQGRWWKVGLVVSFATLAIFGTIGVAWWRLIGIW